MNVKKRMTSFIVDLPENTELYLFGSALYSSNYKDIDLALVYENGVEAQSVINFRKKLIPLMNKEFNCQCSILLLSKIEEQEMAFLDNAKNIRIK